MVCLSLLTLPDGNKALENGVDSNRLLSLPLSGHSFQGV